MFDLNQRPGGAYLYRSRKMSSWLPTMEPGSTSLYYSAWLAGSAFVFHQNYKTSAWPTRCLPASLSRRNLATASWTLSSAAWQRCISKEFNRSSYHLEFSGRRISDPWCPWWLQRSWRGETVFIYFVETLDFRCLRRWQGKVGWLLRISSWTLVRYNMDLFLSQLRGILHVDADESIGIYH